MQEKPIHNKYNGNKNTKNKNFNRHRSCLLYTSDAADE